MIVRNNNNSSINSNNDNNNSSTNRNNDNDNSSINSNTVEAALLNLA